MTLEARLARVTGLFYLVVAVCSGFSELYVRSSLKVPGDAAATADNIAAHATMFRIAFASDLAGITFFLLVALTLYALLKTVNAGIAMAMVVFNAVAVAIMSVNMLNHAAAHVLATNADYAAAFSPERADALVMLFLDMHSYGYSIAEIFFGLWLLPLGYLVYTSGYFPRVLGVMLMVGCFGYLAALVLSFLFPELGATVPLIIAMVGAVAEVSFLLWLLIKGVNVKGRDEHVPAAA